MEKFTKEEIAFESAFVKVIPKPRVLRGIGFQDLTDLESPITAEEADFAEKAFANLPEVKEEKAEKAKAKSRPRLTDEEKAKRELDKLAKKAARHAAKLERAQRSCGSAPSFFPTHDRERVARFKNLPGIVAGSCSAQGGIAAKLVEALSAAASALNLELSELDADLIEYVDINDMTTSENKRVVMEGNKSRRLIARRRNGLLQASERIATNPHDPSVQREVESRWARLGAAEVAPAVVLGCDVGSFGSATRPEELL